MPKPPVLGEHVGNVEQPFLLTRRFFQGEIGQIIDTLLRIKGIEGLTGIEDKDRKKRILTCQDAGLNLLYDLVAVRDMGALLGLIFGSNDPLEVVNQIGAVYTPTVSAAIERFHKSSEKLPQALNPLSIKYREELLNTDEKTAITDIQGDIRAKVRKILAFYGDCKLEDIKETEIDANLQLMLVVLTDGGRILGIGDQGASGRKICMGKLLSDFLGSKGAIAGQALLPIGVDVGTDKEDLLKSDDYQGLKQLRIHGKKYHAFMHLVLKALDQLGVPLIQFEDIQGEEADELLDWARNPKNIENAIVFNDDIEGTAAMLIAAFITAEEREGIDLSNSLFVIPGAGGGALGVKRLLTALLRKKYRLSDKQINKRFIFTDRGGVLYPGRNVIVDGSPKHFKAYQEKNGMVLSDEILDILKEDSELSGKITKGERIELGQAMKVLAESGKFTDNIKKKNGSVFLAGFSTRAGTISEETILAAAKIAQATGKKYAIWGLSNPTRFTDFFTEKESDDYNSAVTTEEKNFIIFSAINRILKLLKENDFTPEQVMWATGSPFPPLPKVEELVGYEKNLKEGDYTNLLAMIAEHQSDWPMVTQGNNFLVFPAVTLAIYLAKKICYKHGLDYSQLPKSQEDWNDLWLLVSESLASWFKENESELYQKGALLPTAYQLVSLTEDLAKKIVNFYFKDQPIGYGGHLDMEIFQLIADQRLKTGIVTDVNVLRQYIQEAMPTIEKYLKKELDKEFE